MRTPCLGRPPGKKATIKSPAPQLKPSVLALTVPLCDC
jgi:hypothetical protein